MYDKFKKKTFKTRERKNVYIIKKIVQNFNKFILISLVYYNSANLMNINTIFLNMHNFKTETNEIVTLTFINLINININLMNININLMNVINELIFVN